MSSFRRIASSVSSLAIGLAVSGDAHALNPKLQPEPLPSVGFPSDPIGPEFAPEFFALLDYVRFPVLAPIKSAVDAGNYDAAKNALLDYMRNRDARWAQAMPSHTPPKYYYDASIEWAQLRALTGEHGAYSDYAMQHEAIFDWKSACCWQGGDLDWTPANSTFCLDCTGQEGCCGNMMPTSSLVEHMNSWFWVGDVAKAYLKSGDPKYATYLIDNIMVDFARDEPVNRELTSSWKTTLAARASGCCSMPIF